MMECGVGKRSHKFAAIVVLIALQSRLYRLLPLYVVLVRHSSVGRLVSGRVYVHAVQINTAFVSGLLDQVFEGLVRVPTEFRCHRWEKDGMTPENGLCLGFVGVDGDVNVDTMYAHLPVVAVFSLLEAVEQGDFAVEASEFVRRDGREARIFEGRVEGHVAKQRVQRLRIAERALAATQAVVLQCSVFALAPRHKE